MQLNKSLKYSKNLWSTLIILYNIILCLSKRFFDGSHRKQN